MLGQLRADQEAYDMISRSVEGYKNVGVHVPAPTSSGFGRPDALHGRVKPSIAAPRDAKLYKRVIP